MVVMATSTGKLIDRETLEEDMNEECPYCYRTIDKKDVKEHIHQQCLEFPVRCKYRCREKLTRSQMEEHENNCEYKKIPCTYEEVGCDIKVRRLYMPKHVQDSVTEHMKLLKDYVTKQMHEKDMKIKDLRRSLTEKDRKIAELKERLDSQQEAVQLQLERMAAAVHQSQTNVFQWRIDEWHRKVVTATSRTARDEEEKPLINSAIFTVADGYRGYLSLFPNGGKRDDRGHVSLFVHLVKGPVDERLQWPFPYSCDLSIVHETDEFKTITCHLQKWDGKKRTRYWERPATEPNEGFGFHRFVSHEQLADNTLTKNGYLLVRFCVNKA